MQSKDYQHLRNCPFCGSTDIDILAYDEEYHTRRVAECINCGARGSVSDSDEEAIESWNTRPLEDKKDKEIEKLKEDLEIQKNLTRQACFESNRAYAETEQWKKMLYDLVDKQAIVDTNPKVVIIGKDTDVSANPTDNNVGSVEE
jgi:Lar family restriction alleviation protein